MTGYVAFRERETVKISKQYTQEDFDRLLSLSFSLDRILHPATPGDKRILRRTLDAVNRRLEEYKESFPEEYGQRLKAYALRVGKIG